jgi:hypothetical protein
MSKVTVNATAMQKVLAERQRADSNSTFNKEVAKGFTTESGITLGLTTEDVALLTGNYVLSKEAAALGMEIPPLIDINGQSHPIAAIEELTAIMLAYGQHRAKLSADLAATTAPTE